MSDLYHLAVALLAAIGVVSLVWLITGALLRPGRASPPIHVVLRPPEHPDDIQRSLERIRWLREWGHTDVRIIVADDGMTQEARDVVGLLCRDDPLLTVCGASEIGEHIIQ